MGNLKLTTIASIQKGADGTAVVTADTVGDIVLKVRYKKYLSDVVPFKVYAYNEPVIYLHGSMDDSRILLEYNEPINPNTADIRIRNDENWRIIEYSCDQTTWMEVPEAALNWYPVDSVAINLTLANFPVCETGILYLRLNVLSGPDAGPSNTVDIAFNLPDGMSYAKNVTFIAAGIESFVQTVAYLTALTDTVLVREDDTFLGWYKEESFITQWDFENDVVETDMTLFGKWLNSVGIDNIDKEQAISIYPNPVTTILNLLHDFEHLDKVEMLDISGRTMLIVENLKEKAINISPITPGIYLLRITNENEIIVLKLSKK